jgi:Amt family ammonium transporter
MPKDPNIEPGRRDGEPVFDQRDWLQITLSSIGDGVITADRDGRVNYLNPVADG